MCDACRNMAVEAYESLPPRTQKWIDRYFADRIEDANEATREAHRETDRLSVAYDALETTTRAEVFSVLKSIDLDRLIALDSAMGDVVRSALAKVRP